MKKSGGAVRGWAAWGVALAEWAIRRPQRALLLAAALPLLAAPGLLRLELKTDGYALVPPNDPAIRVDAEVRDRFGLRDKVLVVVVTEHPDRIYNAGTSRRLLRLTADLAAIEGIGFRHVRSLATEDRERLDPGSGLSFRSFLDPLPETAAALELLREDLDVASAQIFRGILLSEDEQAVAVVVGVPGGDLQARSAVVREIQAVARAAEGDGDRVLVVGAPIAESLLGVHVIEDLARLLPLVLVIISLLLWLGCGRIWGVYLGLIEVAACLIFTFGLMGWMGIPVYLTTAMLPMILTSLGLADEVHIFWRYQDTLQRASPDSPHPAALRETMRAMARPVVFTSVTTAFGFLSFAVSGIRPVLWLGVFTAVGVLFCMLWSLSAVPAALALLDPRQLARSGSGRRANQADRADRESGRSGQRRRGSLAWVAVLWRGGRWSVLVLAAVSLAAIWGATRLYVHDSWIEGFSRTSPFRRATEEVDARLFGTHLLQLEVHCRVPPEEMPQSWEREGPFLDPRRVDEIESLEAFAARQPGVGGALGLASQLTALSHFWQMASPERALPEDAYDMDRLLRRFDLSLGKRRRLEVLDEDLARTVVTLFVSDAGYRRTADLMSSLRAYEREHLHPGSCAMRFAGDLAVSQAMIPAIVESQIRSIIVSLLGELLILWLLYRSLSWALLALQPVVLAIVWVLGFMGATGIPLGVATSLVCAISLGIGVDFSIHFIERFRQSRQASSFQRAREALAETGPAILTNVLLNACGFGVLVFSQVPANGRLGLLMVIALTAGGLLTLWSLGGLLAHRRPTTI